jgi:two-component system sensor histidine kinase YesM
VLKRITAFYKMGILPYLSLLAGIKMRKVWIVYVAIILLPTIFLARFYFEKSSSVLKNEVTSSMLQAVRQVESNIAYRMSKVKEVSDGLAKNMELYERVGRSVEKDTIQVQIDDRVRLLEMIHPLENRNEIQKIRLFVEQRKLYASDNINFYNLEFVKGEAWYPQAVSELGAAVWLNTQYYHYLDSPEGVYIIPLIRTIKDPMDFSHVAGMLAVDMPERLLSSVLETVQFASDNIAVYDGVGTILSDPDKEKIGKAMDSELWQKLSGQNEGIIEDIAKNEYFIYKTITNSDWKVVARIPMEQITSNNEKYTNISTLIIIISCLLLFMITVISIFAAITEGTVRKIRNIGIMIQKEGIDTDIGGSAPGKGFIIGLESSVGRLIRTMKHLMEETYSANAREREAQLRALQAQINPHFLYNTLDTINWMAVRRDADEISTIVNSLAQYFRLSLNKGKDAVTVEDEINLARAYLEIQKNRFDDIFEYEIDVQTDILNCTIPKLSLQPIIENALLHGIQQLKDKRGLLRVEGNKTEEGYRIVVIDNGIGIGEAQLASLLSKGIYKESQSYGLFNVNERIKLYFGHHSGVFIESRLHEGTLVEIRVVED